MGFFDRFENADVRALIEEYPLAWVCAGSGGGFEASLLPLVGIYNGDGQLVELIGHLMRSNPLHAALANDPRATILFKGPDAYVSPEHAGIRNWGPTWNYAQIRIGADVEIDDALTEYSLEVLIEAMEAHRNQPWSVGELGGRYEGMLRSIVGFRATVTSLAGKFKLGQDEKPETFASIMRSLPDEATLSWMLRFNKGRE